MAYTPDLDWVNDAPPGFTAERMNKMQLGIAAATVDAETAQSTADEALLQSSSAVASAGEALDIVAGLGGGKVWGDEGKAYRLLSGVLRNTGSGWSLIDDTGHSPTGVGAVSTTSTYIEIAHAFEGLRVSSLQVTPDETFAAQGLRVGASVGVDATRFYLYTEPADRITDRVYYNAGTSAWVSENSAFGIGGFSGGILTLTHPSLAGPASVGIGNRGGVAALAGPVTATTTQIVFYTGAWGSLAAATSPAGTMNAYVTRYGQRAVPPADPAGVVSASGNLWLTGLIEVADG